MSLKGTKTASNLITGFAGECQANMRYLFAAKVAKKEGYVQIANIFDETARNEQAHASTFLKYLRDEYKNEFIPLNENYTEFPVTYHDTLTNLKGCVMNETAEYEEMYAEFEKVAREEGFDEIADSFKYIGLAEKAHLERFNKLIENMEEGKVFKRDEVKYWLCTNCGYIHEGYEAPEICPSCDHPRDFFELKPENY